MKNRVFRVVVCFALIISLVLGEAAMAFATNKNITPNGVTATSVTLKEYSFQNGQSYAYTGQQIKPVVDKVVVDVTYKKDGGETETATKTIAKPSNVKYKNNTAIGTGYAIVSIEGEKLELPFNIVFGKVKSIKTVSTSYNTIKLTWEKLPGAAGYVIYRCVGDSNNFKRFKTITSGTTTYFSDTKLTLGETYKYKIRPYREKDGKRQEGELSNAITKKARPATSTIVSIKKNSYKSLVISWKKISDASGYRIYRSDSANGEYKRIKTITDAKKLSYIDDGLKCGKKYYYKVRAYKTSKLKKYFSFASEYRAGRTTPQKTAFNEETASWYSSVDLCWNQSKGASGYVIYRSKNSKSGYTKIKTITSAKKTKWTNTGLSGTVKYYYKIRAYKTVNGEKVYGPYSAVYTKYLVSKKLSTLIRTYEGVRYRFGGNTPNGWDCSGFVQWATYYLTGKKIGRTAGAQARGGKYVNKNDMSSWKPGDVLVYKRNGGGVSHVGLYIGGGKMMHALNSRYDTIIQDVSYYESWDRGNYLSGVRRY